jgi:hypothetical protein
MSYTAFGQPLPVGTICADPNAIGKDGKPGCFCISGYACVRNGVVVQEDSDFGCLFGSECISVAKTGIDFAAILKKGCIEAGGVWNDVTQDCDRKPHEVEPVEIVGTTPASEAKSRATMTNWLIGGGAAIGGFMLLSAFAAKGRR